MKNTAAIRLRPLQATRRVTTENLKMKKVIILGASGKIAKQVIDILVKKDDTRLTLFLRDKSRLKNKDVSGCGIIEGDVLNIKQLTEAIKGQDIVYANLSGELEAMARNIVKA